MASRFDRSDRYSRGAIAFHWTIGTLILINLVIGLFHDGMPRDWQVMPVHKSIGITVLVLSIARLAWRLGHRPPPLPPEIAGWERGAAHGLHWLFYALMIVVPLTGWMMSSTGNPPRPLNWFSLFPIPHLPVSKATGDVAHEMHEILGFAFAALVVLHILAALRHHLILRDSVLARMLPIVRAPSR